MAANSINESLPHNPPTLGRLNTSTVHAFGAAFTAAIQLKYDIDIDTERFLNVWENRQLEADLFSGLHATELSNRKLIVLNRTEDKILTVQMNSPLKRLNNPLKRINNPLKSAEPCVGRRGIPGGIQKLGNDTADTQKQSGGLFLREAAAQIFRLERAASVETEARAKTENLVQSRRSPGAPNDASSVGVGRSLGAPNDASSVGVGRSQNQFLNHERYNDRLQAFRKTTGLPCMVMLMEETDDPTKPHSPPYTICADSPDEGSMTVGNKKYAYHLEMEPTITHVRDLANKTESGEPKIKKKYKARMKEWELCQPKYPTEIIAEPLDRLNLEIRLKGRVEELEKALQEAHEDIASGLRELLNFLKDSRTHLIKQGEELKEPEELFGIPVTKENFTKTIQKWDQLEIEYNTMIEVLAKPTPEQPAERTLEARTTELEIGRLQAQEAIESLNKEQLQIITEYRTHMAELDEALSRIKEEMSS